MQKQKRGVFERPKTGNDRLRESVERIRVLTEKFVQQQPNTENENQVANSNQR